jgi:Ufm1-specific protease 2
VDIGDKEAKFIGSKQWIGSMEVGFVLETQCGIQSRFLSVSSGADMASKVIPVFQVSL